MNTFAALARNGFRAGWRSSAQRAFLALAIAGAALAPSVASFAFSDADALAREGALGTALLFAPLAALFSAVALVSGDRGGEGLAPDLVASPSTTLALAATATGLATAALLGTLIAVGIAGLTLGASGVAVPVAPTAAAVLAAAVAGLPFAGLGILLGTVAGRRLAGSLAAAAVLGLLLSPGPGLIVSLSATFFPARDAAFGAFPAGAALLATASSLALSAAFLAASTAALRIKELAPATSSP